MIETSNAYGRGLLSGVRRFLSANSHWSVYLGEHGRSETDLSWLEGWAGDGVIARIENQQIADRVAELNVPTVDVSAARLLPQLTCVETNDDVIARWAVDHFATRGLKHLAYCGDARFAWSVTRGGRFARHARDRGFSPTAYEIVASGALARDRRAMAEWLLSLPKPVGILACYDMAGHQLLEACRIAGLSSPESVAVLGVDNDELLCTLTMPPLSSIQPDAPAAGFAACSLLETMMSGEHVDARLHAIDPLRVVSRQSTDLLYVDDPQVARALQLIRGSADRGIGVEAIQRDVGLSRRALDHRFVRALGRTVHQEIARIRMERLAELLVATDWTLAELAEALGFPHAEYMGVVFKKSTGRSPGEYRNANRRL